MTDPPVCFQHPSPPMPWPFVSLFSFHMISLSSQPYVQRPLPPGRRTPFSEFCPDFQCGAKRRPENFCLHFGQFLGKKLPKMQNNLARTLKGINNKNERINFLEEWVLGSRRPDDRKNPMFNDRPPVGGRLLTRTLVQRPLPLVKTQSWTGGVGISKGLHIPTEQSS